MRRWLLAQTVGQPVAMNGKSKAGEAFQNIARRLNGEQVPFLNLDQKDGLFSRIARMMRSGGN